MSNLPLASAAGTTSSAPGPATLARHMGLFALIVYGVGDMVGAGVYATIGKAAGSMGNAVWLAFVGSMVAAMLSGLSYASIASRYPRAAGAAYVTHRAFRLSFLSYFVGLAVTASGLTSMATSSNAVGENLYKLINGRVPIWVLLILFLAAITFLNFWGIRESLWGNLLCTAVEVGGLLFVIAVGMRFWGSVDYLQFPGAGEGDSGRTLWSGTTLVLSGSVLTFFSFVGFEDMINVSEEVKDPSRTMPMGILIALGITTLLYIAISVTVVSVVSYESLATAAAPFELVTRKAAPWLPDNTYTFITIFAVANTALINYIMGSRLVYGMARQGLLPAALGTVHSRRRTPHVSILTLGVIVTILALSARIPFGGTTVNPIRQLADATALLLLGCFAIVNVALIVLKRRPGEPRGKFEVPLVVPVLGATVCGVLVLNRLLTRNAEGDFEWRAPATAAAMGTGILLLYLVHRPKAVTEASLTGAEHGAEA